jgi:polysaccharide biosynthesis transport protein
LYGKAPGSVTSGEGAKEPLDVETAGPLSAILADTPMNRGPAAPEAPHEAAMDLRSIVGRLLVRWKLILFLPILALPATWGVLKAVPSEYQSTAEILIFDPHSQIASVEPVSQLDISVPALSTETEVLKSRSLLLRVVKELHLDEDPEFQVRDNTAPSAWLGFMHAGGPKAPQNASTANGVDRAADVVAKHLQVEQVGFSYVLAVTVSSQSPQMAQLLAKTITDDYLASQRRAQFDQMQQVGDWLRSHLNDLQNRIGKGEAAIEKLRAQGGFTTTGINSNIIEQRISDLNTQIEQAQADMLSKRAAFQQANRLLENHGDVTAIAEVVASKSISDLRQQRLDLVRQQANFRARMGVSDPAVVTQLASLDREIDAEAAHVVDSMQSAYEAALQREQSLQTGLQKLTDTLANLSPDYIRLQQLERVAKADRQLYETYLTRFNEISTRQTYQGPQAQIISPAPLPEFPSKPKRVLFYGFGGVLGLGLGLGLAFLLEYYRPRIKTRADVEETFGYPVLGVIPFIQPGERRQRVEHGPLMRTIVDAPLSQVSDAVRAIRVRLSYLEGSPRVILLTSSLAGEGKSAAAMLLAASYATSGQKALLVDCDLRHRSVSRAFGMPEPGLAHLLAGDRVELNDVIIPGPAAYPHVLPAGSTTASPTDLLIPRRMCDVIAQLRQHYETVVLDVSPVLSVVDTLALAAMADQIIMVVEWNRTPREVVAEAFKLLRRDAPRIAGVVLNKVNLKQLRAYDYAYGQTNSYCGHVQPIAIGSWTDKSRAA